MRRNISRVKVLSELYQYDLLNQQLNVDNFDELLKEVDDTDIEYDYIFAASLYRGVIDNIARIDRLIALCLEKYPLDRLSYVDRSLLRIGTYEMLYTKTPHNIIINEIVNLSKEYSQTEEHKTSKFNNAVLDAISKTIKMKENK